MANRVHYPIQVEIVAETLFVLVSVEFVWFWLWDSSVHLVLVAYYRWYFYCICHPVAYDEAYVHRLMVELKSIVWANFRCFGNCTRMQWRWLQISGNLFKQFGCDLAFTHWCALHNTQNTVMLTNFTNIFFFISYNTELIYRITELINSIASVEFEKKKLQKNFVAFFAWNEMCTHKSIDCLSYSINR